MAAAATVVDTAAMVVDTAADMPVTAAGMVATADMWPMAAIWAMWATVDMLLFTAGASSMAAALSMAVHIGSVDATTAESRYGHVRRWYGGRWWPYGVGSCWAPSPIGYVWTCG